MSKIYDYDYERYIESAITNADYREERDDIKNIKTGFEGFSADEIKIKLASMGFLQDEINMLIDSIWNDHH